MVPGDKVRCYDTYLEIVIVTLRTVTNVNETWQIGTCGNMGDITLLKTGGCKKQGKREMV